MQSGLAAQDLKVYVSGFLDWPASVDEADGFDRWRCMVNPSGRLFIGAWYAGAKKPAANTGELPDLLSRVASTGRGQPIQWYFDTLPVIWGVGTSIASHDFDIVINIGLGVYDDVSKINLEKGAYNGRGALTDAAANVPAATAELCTVIDEDTAEFLVEPVAQAVKLDRYEGPIGATGYAGRPIDARSTNAFICNETHHIQLRRLGDGRLRQAYFIHIPKPENDARYAGLAVALTTIITGLVTVESTRSELRQC